MLLGEGPGTDHWRHVEALIGDAFGVDADVALYGNDRLPGVVALLSSIAARANPNQPLTAWMWVPEARALARLLRSDADLARLIPFVAPVSDAGFAARPNASSPGVLDTTGRVVLEIGSYATIGPLSVGGVSWLDPEQGCTSDCYLIGAMIAIAWARPHAWLARLDRSVGGTAAERVLRVAFHGHDGRSVLRHFSIPPRVPLDPHGNLLYARSPVTTEMWPALLERAYVTQVCRCDRRQDAQPTVGDYFAAGATKARFPESAGRMLIGGRAKYAVGIEGESPLTAALARLCDGELTRHPTMAFTWWRSRSLPWPRWQEARLLPEHCYAVLGRMSRRSGDYVILVDPFGTHAHARGYAGGSWSAGAPRNLGEPVQLGHRGTFAIPAAWFDRLVHRLCWVETPGSEQ